MDFFNKKSGLLVCGLIFGALAAVLAATGNPANMAFCIACFIRDIAGAVGLHSAAKLSYIRPEVIGLSLGALIAALASREFRATGGSQPVIRFFLGFFMMVGALVFLGCPLRMVLRLAGGDANAIVGLVGFVAGVATGALFLKKGFNLGRAKKFPPVTGYIYPLVLVVIFVLGLAGIFTYSTEGPGSQRAPIFLALAVGLLAGALCQKSRLCMAGGFRDLLLIKDGSLALQFFGIFLVMLVYNLITKNFHFGFEGQPIAHTMQLWNFLGLYAVGFAAVLAGGCPLRQLILAGQGNVDSAITVLGLFIGAGACHRFNWAASADGVPAAGQIACVVAIVLLFALAIWKSKGRAA